MNSISKSLHALDDFIRNVSKEEKERIWIEVKEMKFTGPTIEEYFTTLLNSNNITFKFDKGIELIGNNRPPDNAFKLSINETPKYSLESFFCNLGYGNTIGFFSTSDFCNT